MDLLLWRHAQAHDSEPDILRSLTHHGHRQAKKVALWLQQHYKEPLYIIVSPTTRTKETANAYSDTYAVLPAVGPDADPQDILSASGWPDGKKSCLIVGHQPTLGQVAARLLGSRHKHLSFHKGCLWWFRSSAETGDQHKTELVTVISPEML